MRSENGSCGMVSTLFSNWGEVFFRGGEVLMGEVTFLEGEVIIGNIEL